VAENHALLETLDGLSRWVLVPDPPPLRYVLPFCRPLRPPFPPDVLEPTLGSRSYELIEKRQTAGRSSYFYYREVEE